MYSVSELITDAYYLSRVVAREFETVSSSQTKAGLSMLNEVISDHNISSAMLPYYDEITLPVSAGEDQVFFQNMVTVETITILNGDVRHSLNRVGRDRFFNEPRVNNIRSLPYMYFYETRRISGVLNLYYSPDKDYVLTITGKRFQNPVALDFDMNNLFARFYTAYIKYALAERICNDNNITVNQGLQKILDYYQREISNMNPTDFSVNIANPYSGSVIDPVQSQLSNGWYS